MPDERGEKKNQGMQAAKEWLKTAPVQVQIDVAGSKFNYGETLNGLIDEGLSVPCSNDRDFSWGFFKQVKSRLNHKL